MLTKIKTESDARLSEQKRHQERKRNILIYIQRDLTDLGYIDSAQRVAKETNLNLENVDVADNVDLDLIFQEYEDYYSMKFGKKPKIFPLSKSL